MRYPIISKEAATIIFIVFYCYVMVLQSCASITKFPEQLLEPFRTACLYVGLWSHPELFFLSNFNGLSQPGYVCDTESVNFLVDFNDGTAVTWCFPQAMPFFRSPSLFRNYLHVYLFNLLRTSHKKQLLWPALAAYVARQNDSSVHHPVGIKLIVQTTFQSVRLTHKVSLGDLLN
jgi:hypothetical protein